MPLISAARMERELLKSRSPSESMTYVYEHALRVMKPGYTHEDVKQVLRAILLVLRRTPIIEMPKKVPHGFFDKVAALGIKLMWGATVGVAKSALEELGSLAADLVTGSEVTVKKSAKKAGSWSTHSAGSKKAAKKTAKKAGRRMGAKKTAKRGSGA